MKRYPFAAGLLKLTTAINAGMCLLITGLAGLSLTACDLLGIEVKEWELSGEAVYNVSPALPEDEQVKMAGFFFSGGDERLTDVTTMVTNVVTVNSDATAFTLDFDANGLNPDDCDRILLFMWIEEIDTANNTYDDGEEKCIVVPKTGDAVFSADTNAGFVYYKERAALENGWYVLSPSGAREILSADLSSVLLTNEDYF